MGKTARLPRPRKAARWAGRPTAEERPLRLEYRTPEELAENPANWRQHPPEQIAALGGALAEVGWAGACLYNERTGRLIDGHARRRLAIERGDKVVPVLIGSWTEEQERKALATHDPIAAMATADAAKLADLLRDVHSQDEALAALLNRSAAGLNVTAPDVPAEHWRDMPEYTHEDQTSAFRAIVHFASDADRKAFEELIGQRIPDNTKAIWYPPQKREVVRGKRVVSNES